MGTKANPGPYDCYANAAPDEPLFTLLARDPIAPYLVRAWAYLKAGMPRMAEECMRSAATVQEPVVLTPDLARKLEQAKQVAVDMTAYQIIQWATTITQENPLG